jgi:hypothetical protein
MCWHHDNFRSRTVSKCESEEKDRGEISPLGGCSDRARLGAHALMGVHINLARISAVRE